MGWRNRELADSAKNIEDSLVDPQNRERNLEDCGDSAALVGVQALACSGSTLKRELQLRAAVPRFQPFAALKRPANFRLIRLRDRSGFKLGENDYFVVQNRIDRKMTPSVFNAGGMVLPGHQKLQVFSTDIRLKFNAHL